MKSSANRIAQLALFTFWATYLPACESIDYGAIGSVSQAVTFPAANADWVPVEQAGLGLSDPDTDAQNNGRNIVGTSQYPAVFIAANDTTFMVRLRTNDSPTSGQNLSQYGWGIMFETDGDTSAYEYLLLANASGSNDVLNFLKNTTKTGGFLDDAETTLHSEAIVTTAGGNVKVSTADSSLFSGQDYFLDIGIPFSVLKAEGITLATPLRVIIGTSSNGTRLSEDLGGTSSTPATATYSSVLSDTTFIDGQPGDLDGDTVINTTDIDNDNDGIRDTAENSLGVDPDADHDSDGIPNWKDKSDTGAGASSGCTDSASDGVCDTLDTAFDADSDGVANHNDVDSDNDGIIDLLEAGHGGTDANGDGLVDSPYGTNGLANALETGTDSGTVNYVLLDTDGDTTKDIYDLDSDADTTKDVSEAGLGSLDANDNGRLDSTTDADDDGLMDPTAVDANAALFGHPALTLPDTDNDDIPDPYDFDDGGPGVGDSDSDTYSDSTECASGWPCPDGNRDGVPNYMVATVDTDGDGVDNGDDDAINDPYDCLDSDSDSCDDCSQTGANHSGGDTSNDGADADSDGICDLTDDSDSDGVVDATDTNRTNSSICRDVDADSCDDCAVVHTGGGSTSNDGDDDDSDGICDLSDDSDGDGVVDATDTNRTSASFCRDVDADSCDDCTNVHTGGGSTSNDGTDADSDGLCDLGDDSDGDGVVDATDTNRTNSSICRDVDSDGCDDCSVVQTGGGSTSNDGNDADSDGICDATDDSDGDGVVDATDLNRTSSSICRDVDADSCDDCAVVHTGGGSTSNDGTDSDSDGLCDLGDDSDGDGVVDATDLARTNSSICRDVDADSCDDCTNVHTGGGSTSNDGNDADSDGICDATDDSDGDGVVDATDLARTNSSICRDVDTDGCDDCAVVHTGGGSTSNDGNDADSDGTCDLSDDSDSDGVVDATDTNRTNSSICRDVDTDGCDDCSVVHTGGGSTSNDGNDADSDGICDATDDSDSDGVVDATDTNRSNSSICRDVDSDGCDDCAVVHTGGGSTSNDGADADSDGTCDATDDSDGDGVVDATDLARTNSSICRDVDTDGCDDCAVVHTGGGSTSNDGADADSDGTCDLSDDSDSDGVVDATDLARTNSSICQDVDSDGCDDCAVVHTGGGSTSNDGNDADSDGICDATDDSDGDGVVDATDLARTNSSICQDVDSDTCDDCTNVHTGGGSTSNDGNDADSDGTCDLSDDSDNDGVVDATDLARTNSSICQDVDSDGCDDCAVVHTGGGSTSNDGNDADSDGTCDLTDDSDNDGVVDATDLNRTNSSICQDVDSDGCDDCAIVHTGGGSTSNDGADVDSDGTCDATDDSDGDGVVDATDTNRTNSSICRDVDADGCDDCANVHTGGGSTSNDGADADSDGTCNLTDDSDGDGVVDATDLARTNSSICRDVDSDTCDDCSVVHTGGGSTSNDGNDANSDGICDATDDSDNDGVVDATDLARTNSSICQDVDSDGCDDCAVVHTGGGSTSDDGTDTDSDGICDVTDDSDNDGVVDATDLARTNSSICQDVDSDGCDDCAVVHTGGGSTSNDGDDADSDGTCDVTDDSDNDGVVDATDLARTNSSICQDVDSDTCDDCAVVHTGGGSTSNDGADTDHNGICDLGETADLDGDGTRDVSDADIDGDGIPNATEGALDTDNDGLINSRDLDADGDGLLDTVEAGLADLDEDLDGRIDDTDDVDDDGLPAVADANDGDAQVTTSNWAPLNSDETGEPDFLDLDSDDDGIVDAIEGYDYDGDGDADVLPTPADVNDDGVDDAYFAWLGGNTDTELPNHDVDNLPDYRDADDDDDGIDTADECVDSEVGCEDADNDYIPDYLDPAEPTPDAGAPTSDTSSEVNVTSEQSTTSATPSEDTSVEVPTTSAELPTSSAEVPTSSDDPAPTSEAPSSTSDVTSTPVVPTSETPDESTSQVPTPTTDVVTSEAPTTGPVVDTSSSAEPTGAPLTDDNPPVDTSDETSAPVTSSESFTTSNESETTDAGTPLDAGTDTCDETTYEGCPDTDRDGVPDFIECPDSADVCPDTDGDGTPDYRDTDDDGDGIRTRVEIERGDTDNDGILDYADTDDDGDGVPSSEEINSRDLDRDGVPDAIDPDEIGFAGGSGCSVEHHGSSSNLGWTLTLVMAAAVTLARRRRVSRTTIVASTCLAVASVTSESGAQEVTSRFQLNRYHPAPLVQDGFAANRATALGAGNWSLGFQLDYSHDPLVVESPAGSADAERYSLIGTEVVGNLGFAVGLGDRWTPFVNVPVVLALSGERVDGLPAGDGATLGNPNLGTRVLIAGSAETRAHFSAQLGVELPLSTAISDTQSFVGSNGVTFAPQLIGDIETDSLIWSLSVGARLPTTKTPLFNVTLQHEGTAVLGAALPVGDSFSAHAEVFASTFLNDAFSRSTTAIEGLLGAKLAPTQSLKLGAAIGTGFTRGIGEPDVRVILSAGFTHFAPEVAAPPPPPPPTQPADTDGDGLTDPVDACPAEPEDVDQFEDSNGCPEPDNDADALLDAQDKCPLEAEDRDTFADEDGCPDPDNDADTVLDTQDKCPQEPGTVELAGCPIPDGDKDTIPDATDACPTEPGVTEYNGCKTKQLVQVTGEKIELLDRVYFETNKDVILPQSFPLLENVASVLTAHPELTKVVVEGHTDNAGNKAKNQKLSHKRAEAVVTFLVARGVAADRLSAQGFGQDKPIADNKTTEGRATNRRVEFRISSKAP